MHANCWQLHDADRINIKEMESICLEYVIIYFDEPQLVAARGPDGALYLDLAVEDGVVVRWLRAPVTEQELQALSARSLTVADLILRPGLMVFDRCPSLGSITNAWRLSPEQVPESARPSVDSYLPLITTQEKEYVE